MSYLILILSLISFDAFASDCIAEQYIVGTEKILSFDPAARIKDPRTHNGFASFGMNEEQPANSFGDSICKMCSWGSKAISFRFGGNRGVWPVLVLDRHGKVTDLDVSNKNFKILSEITCQR